MIARFYAFILRLVLLCACVLSILGLAIVVQRYPQFFMLGAVALAWRRFRRGPSGSNWTHGSATVASPELVAREMSAESGIILGKVIAERPARWRAVAGLLSPRITAKMAVRQFLAAFLGAHWLKDQMMRISTGVHYACYAPAGAGKGRSIVIPNMMSYPNSLVALDVKGELHTITAGHRKRRFGHRIITLAPLGINGKPVTSDTLNPFDFIDEKVDSFLDDCRELANQLVTRTGRETDEHWLDSAVLVITAFVAFVCACEQNRKHRNLNTLRLLVSSRVAYEKSVKTMQQVTGFDGVIQRLGGQLSWFQDKELSSVLTSVQRFTQFLDSPAIARNVESSSFDPRILKGGKATVYLILPHDKLTSLAPLQRMWIGTLMRVTTRGEVSEKNQIMWILDEFAHIGRIAAVEDAVTLMRGMGVRLFFCFQSLNQMKDCFGDKAPTILDNIGTQIYFGISSFESAEAVSKRIGETTISTTSYNRSTSDSRPVGGNAKDGPPPGNHSTSDSYTRSDLARRVIRPEEILTLDEGTAIILHRNLPVTFARLVKHYEDREFRRGGTGESRGLGLAAGLAAVLVLAMGLGMAELAVRLPHPQVVSRALFNYADRMPSGTAHRPRARRYAPPRPAWRPVDPQFRYGFLAPIQ